MPYYFSPKYELCSEALQDLTNYSSNSSLSPKSGIQDLRGSFSQMEEFNLEYPTLIKQKSAHSSSDEEEVF